MSYLTLANDSIATTKKMVVSFWFRVPSKTLEDITKEYQEYLDDETGMARRRFLGIIPLMTFGPADLKAQKFYSEDRQVGISPQTVEVRWTDGPFGFPACTGAGWKETAFGEPLEATAIHYKFGASDQDGEGGGGVDDSGVGSGTPGVGSGTPGVGSGTPGVGGEGEGEDGLLAGGGYELDGSYIGVDCIGDWPALSINIVMPKKAKTTGGASEDESKALYEGAYPVTKSIEWSGHINEYVGGGNCPGAPVKVVGSGPTAGRICYTEILDTRSVTTTQEGNADVVIGCVPETFRLLPAFRSGGVHNGDRVDQTYNGVKINPDTWHHLLLSFDCTQKIETEGQALEEVTTGGVPTPVEPEEGKEGERTKDAALMWVSFDNANLTKRELSIYWPDGHENDNALLSVGGMFVAQSVNVSTTETDNPIAKCSGIDETLRVIKPLPTYAYTPTGVDFSNIGLPASTKHQEAVRRVEMAELQIFTDVSLDTGELGNRRAFIDKDGTPVAPDKKGDKDDPGGSIELLGKKPEILLHGSGNWQTGYNTGTLGIAVAGDGTVAVLTDGQFTPTAKIEKYKLEPKLDR